MEIYAVHHVRVGRAVFTPGEYIDAGIPADQLDRLLRLGAVRMAEDSGDHGTPPPPQKEAVPIKAQAAPEDAEGEAEAQEPEDADGEVEAEEEADFEPPTIDASDGLVSAVSAAAKTGKGKKKG